MEKTFEEQALELIKATTWQLHVGVNPMDGLIYSLSPIDGGKDELWAAFFKTPIWHENSRRLFGAQVEEVRLMQTGSTCELLWNSPKSFKEFLKQHRLVVEPTTLLELKANIMTAEETLSVFMVYAVHKTSDQ